jgi:hypothetical protein
MHYWVVFWRQENFGYAAWKMNELSSSRNGLFILAGYIVSRPKTA